jgi:oligoribonuclease
MTWLPWIDLETTGLDPKRDCIIEIALVLTSEDLEHVVLGPNLAINLTKTVIMDDFVDKMHRSSGLFDDVVSRGVDIEDAEGDCIMFLEEYSCYNQPLCNNNPQFDRNFLKEHMPHLAAMFHYRNIDVSSVMELCARWAPHLDSKRARGPVGHRAQADVLDSIGLLRYYRDCGFLGVN